MFKENEVVWVRDMNHPNYKKWGKAVYIKEVGEKYLVMYFYSTGLKKGKPMSEGNGCCGIFPEIKKSLTGKDEIKEDIYA